MILLYDPNQKTGKLSLKASLGTIKYASGQIAKNSAQNISIKTPIKYQLEVQILQ